MKIDYKALGFKAGLEVHHQLDTERKLFCRCPIRLTGRPHDAELLRHMRPTLSELGEYDGTALMEFKTKKDVVYQIYNDMNCTYEMDDTPPFLVNDQALDISIAVAKTFGMSLVDEVHITRKQYLDGSIPTGFQRTAIIGVGGAFEMNGKTVNLLHMSLEEDSCREVSDQGHTIVFKADRLGFPLIEVVTAPDFKTPDEAGAGAEAIRRALWNLNRVRRGPGSARHDVNCSIEGGTRIEIKGVPRIADIPLLLHNEALRQKALLEIRDTLRARGITEKVIVRHIRDVSAVVKSIEADNYSRSADHRFVAVKLKGFGGLLNKQTQEHAVFADEFAGRIRVIACLDSRPNILFSESGQPGAIEPDTWREIYRLVDATHHDSVIVVFGPEPDVETAVSEIYIRAREATHGVPSETRQALKNGSNDFERILPGPDRMYPDTDHPPIPLTDDRVRAIEQSLPEVPWRREHRYRADGLTEDSIRNLAISPLAPIYEIVSEKYPDHKPQFGELFGCIVKGLRRNGFPPENLTGQHYFDLAEQWINGNLYREGIRPLLMYMAMHPEADCQSARIALGMIPVNDSEMVSVIEAASRMHAPKPFPTEDARFRWIMGQVMESLRGRVKGARVAESVRRTLREILA
ncbi:MAG TPA: Glu-tRNA(Gln) amidotransferase subunit GatE [bacterium]|nr:Glu-tRNA(Gln) amidotransferase subunit GatE [bacterium]